MRLSHSKLSQLLSCPMSYYLSNIVGLYKKEEKPALMIGSAVHWGIEHSTYDLTDFWKQNGSFKTQDAYTREQVLAESMVFGYLKHKNEIFKEILTDPKNGEQLELLEETHELFIDGILPSNLYPEPHKFVGIIDLLLTTDRGFIIIDYKTSTFEPNWDDYLEQLYRYIFEVRSNFPDIPIVKIGIVNIRKTGIRQKKNENEDEFKARIRAEYDNNSENLVNYHEFFMDDINEQFLDDYVKNLSKMADFGQKIHDEKLFYINYGAAKNQYGKSDWWDIFYHTPDCNVLYGIKDYVWNEETEQFEDHRDCVMIDMQACDFATGTNQFGIELLNKYDHFKQHLLETKTESKEEFFAELKQQHLVDKNLLELYWRTFIREKEVKKNDAK